jgi:hypothetical protein
MVKFSNKVIWEERTFDYMVTGVQMMLVVLVNIIEDNNLDQKVLEVKKSASQSKMMGLKQEKWRIEAKVKDREGMVRQERNRRYYARSKKVRNVH